MAISPGLWQRLSNSLSMGLSQSFPSRRDGKTSPCCGFHFTVQKRPVLRSSGTSLAKRPHLGSGTETHPSDKRSADGCVSASSADTRRKGAMRVSAPDV